jgi:hypothetical protein
MKLFCTVFKIWCVGNSDMKFPLKLILGQMFNIYLWSFHILILMMIPSFLAKWEYMYESEGRTWQRNGNGDCTSRAYDLGGRALPSADLVGWSHFLAFVCGGTVAEWTTTGRFCVEMCDTHTWHTHVCLWVLRFDLVTSWTAWCSNHNKGLMVAGVENIAHEPYVSHF